MLTVPEHMSKPTVFSRVHVTRSLVLCVCFVDHCLLFRLSSFGNCVVCPSSIYGFLLHRWYLQARRTDKENTSPFFRSEFIEHFLHNVFFYRFTSFSLFLLSALNRFTASYYLFDIFTFLYLFLDFEKQNKPTRRMV